jgi:TP901 family phage tail tape measure protein
VSDTTVIDVIVQVSDETGSGARSAEANVSKLERSIMGLQKQIMGMKGKSKLEVVASLKDMASKGIQGVASAGKDIAGRVWTVTMKAKDLVTAPFKKVMGLISSPVTQVAAFAGISLGVADTLNTFKDFEAAMSQVQAVSGATGSDLAKLTDKAKEMGASTKFTAAESAEAMNYMAMAGWKTKDMLGGIEGIMSLAAASGESLGTTSDIVTDALTAFGMKASDAGHFSDVMAAASSNANTDVSMMGETFKYAGSMAGSLGYSIEDVALATGLMANSGIKASMAGTALNSIMTRLATDAGASSKKLGALGTLTKKLGVEFYDSKGNARDLSDVLKEMRKATKGMTDEEKSNIAKTIAGTEAQKGLLAILNASEKDYKKLSKSINNSDGAAKDMADTMQDNLSGSITYLQSAVDGVKISLGEKLAPRVKGIVDWLTGQMPAVEKALGSFLDMSLDKVDDIKDKFARISSSDEFKNADLFGKAKIAWDKIIAEPFSEWWNGPGKARLAGKAEEIGGGLGSALHSGIMGLLGVDTGGAVTEGADIGRAFSDAFVEAFNGKEVGKAIWKAIKDGIKGLASDAATLLPGGKEASSTSAVSAAILGASALKTGSKAHKVYKGGKAIVKGAKEIGRAVANASGVSDGIQIAKAAKGGGTAAQSALAMAKNGALGKGAKLGAKLAGGASKASAVASKGVSGIGKLASKAAVPLAAVTSAVEMGVDAYHGTKKAKEWTGAASTGNKVASGVGAALGGTGNGVLGDGSAGKKAVDVGGGALKGAGIGAAVGSIIPGAGTAAGAGIGAAVGAAGAAIGGSNIAKCLSKAGGAIKGFFTKTVPEGFGEFTQGAKGFFTESVPNAVNGAKEKVTGFFTETIPEKFGEFKDGLESLFTEQIPYALGYAAGKVTVFFTETVPQKFEELWTGISGFFTETVPAAVSAAGAAITNFFTVSVPQFFTQMWEGITGFFTETVPETLETIGTTLKTFFTETVPGKVEEIWKGVLGFFTETIPGAVSSISEGISGFFSGIKEKVTGFFGSLKDKVTGFLSGAAESASAGYSVATEKHAEGGIMTRPHLGLVAEDGAEAIIPLSGKRRKRGISLWEKAGKMLGVKPYAEGGIVGIVEPENDTPGKPKTPSITDWPEPTNPVDDTPEPVPVPVPDRGNGSGMNVPVTIQNMTFEINVNGGDAADTQSLVETIRENVRGMTDEIAYQLATAIQQVYANTPKESWEV